MVSLSPLFSVKVPYTHNSTNPLYSQFWRRKWLKTYAVVNSPFRKNQNDFAESGLVKVDDSTRPMKSDHIATPRSRIYQ